MSTSFKSFATMPRPAEINLALEWAFGFGIGVWNIAFNFHLLVCGYPIAQIGTLVCTGFLATAAASCFCGRLSARLGYARVSSLGAALVALSLVAVAFTTWMPAFYLCQILYGTGLACLMSVDYPLILSLLPANYSRFGYNMTLFFYTLSGLFGSLFAGIFPKLVPNSENPYRTLLLIAAASYTILCVGRLFLPVRKHRPKSGAGVVDTVKKPAVQSFLLFGFVTMTMYNIVMAMLNVTLRNHFEFSDSSIGLFYSLFAVAGSIATPVVGLLGRRYHGRSIATATLFLQMLTMLLMVFAPAKLFIALICMRTLTINFVYAIIDNPMLQSVSPAHMGSYSGLRTCANYLGMGLGSVMSGALISIGSYSALFLIAAGFAFAQIIAFHYLCLPHIPAYKTAIPGFFYRLFRLSARQSRNKAASM